MIDQGKLGTISNLDISQAHDYHGMSVMRRLLGTGMENCRITARTYDFPVNYHCGREGLHKGEKTNVQNLSSRMERLGSLILPVSSILTISVPVI